MRTMLETERRKGAGERDLDEAGWSSGREAHDKEGGRSAGRPTALPIAAALVTRAPCHVQKPLRLLSLSLIQEALT